MTFIRPLTLFCFLGFASATQAQDIPDALETILAEQGYEVTSTRFTWLGRIYVEASNGDQTRSILIARQTGRILQDDVIAGKSRATHGGDAGDDRRIDGPDQTGAPKDRPSRGTDKKDRPSRSERADKGPRS